MERVTVTNYSYEDSDDALMVYTDTGEYEIPFGWVSDFISKQYPQVAEGYRHDSVATEENDQFMSEKTFDFETWKEEYRLHSELIQSIMEAYLSEELNIKAEVLWQ